MPRRIEFFYKETGKVVEDPSSFYIDSEGDVVDITNEYDETYFKWMQVVDWRVIETE